MNKSFILTLNAKDLTEMERSFESVVSGLRSPDTVNESILAFIIISKQIITKYLCYRSRFAVRTRSFCAEIAKSIIKSLALLTTCNQPYETQCILRAIDSIKELFLVNPEGDKRVSVPVQDIGCEVGLHRRKWGDCGLNKLRGY